VDRTAVEAVATGAVDGCAVVGAGCEIVVGAACGPLGAREATGVAMGADATTFCGDTADADDGATDVAVAG
jgi:hypothetical protein